MKHPLLTHCLLSAVLLLGACRSTSQTLIEPGQTFALGGEQRSPLLLEGRNIGRVPVDVLRRAPGQSEPELLARVAPGALFSRRFAAGETALLRNPSAQTRAEVRAEFNASMSSLSMRYEANPPVAASAPGTR